MFLKGVHRAEWHKHEANQSFPDAYFFHPKDLKELFESHDVRTLEIATCEGLSCHLQEATNKIYEDKQKWDFWIKILLRACTDPHNSRNWRAFCLHREEKGAKPDKNQLKEKRGFAGDISIYYEARAAPHCFYLTP